MSQRDNILNELNELQSSLPAVATAVAYLAPAGYFDSLPEQIMGRIRVLEAETAHEELVLLSPLLSGLKKQTPYSVPADYFAMLENGLANIAQQESNPSARQEPEQLSPLLGSLQKQMPYSVPAGYFDNLEIPAVPAEARVVSMATRSRRWIRYAAAAVVTAFIALGGFYYFNRNEHTDPAEKSYTWVKENMSNVSTDALDEFVTIAENETSVIASERNEVRELIKNIPDAEIQEFLNDTEALTADADEDILLN